MDFMASISVNIRALSACDRMHPRLQSCTYVFQIVFSDSCKGFVLFSVESLKCVYHCFI